MKSTMDLEHWLPVMQMWDWEFMQAYPGQGIPPDTPDRWNVLGDMRDLIDKPGHDIHSVVPLVWMKGDRVKQHVHPEWTVIYYVALGDPPVPILLGNGPYTPRPGECLILEPNTPHEVPTSLSQDPRIALAMRVTTQ